jgi:hypothetical protein
MNTDVIDQPTSSQRPRAKPSVAKSWLKAIELTSGIEADPGYSPTSSRTGRNGSPTAQP